jgi:hypothetical protein
MASRTGSPSAACTAARSAIFPSTYSTVNINEDWINESATKPTRTPSGREVTVKRR